MPLPIRFIAPDYNNNANNYQLNRKYAVDASSPEYQNSLNTLQNDTNGVSILGNVIYDKIKLYYNNTPENYTAVNKGHVNISNVSCEFDIVKFSVSQTRNVVTTAVNGLNGEIKEFIADGDYTIDCSATIVFDGIDYYSYAYMQNIYNMFLIQDSIGLESNILNNVFGIRGDNCVVVTDYKFSQSEIGMRNVQQIDFTLITDNPLNYNLIFITQ